MVFTLEQEIEGNLKQAEGYALQGNARDMEIGLSVAQGFARRVGKDITTRVAVIKKTGYPIAVANGLKEVRRLALLGSAASMEMVLGYILDYAGYIQQDIAEKVKDIREIGFNAGIMRELKWAWEYVSQGNPTCAEQSIRQAEHYVNLLDQYLHTRRDISEEVKDIRVQVAKIK